MLMPWYFLSKERRIQVTNHATILLLDALFTHTHTHTHHLSGTQRFVTRSFQTLNWYRYLYHKFLGAYWWFNEWLDDLIREQRCTQSQSGHSVAAPPLGRLIVQVLAPGNLQQERKYLQRKGKQILSICDIQNLMMVKRCHSSVIKEWNYTIRNRWSNTAQTYICHRSRLLYWNPADQPTCR